MRFGTVWRREGDWLGVLLVAPALLFPSRFPVLSIAVLVLFLADRLVRHRCPATPRLGTPFDLALTLLAVMTLVGTSVSPALDVTLPKLSGVLLGLLTFRAVFSASQPSRRFWWAVALYLALGAAFVAVGVLTTNWQNKSQALSAVTSRIPRSSLELPGAEGGVNANALGASTLFVLPLVLMLTMHLPAIAREVPQLSGLSTWGERTVRVVAWSCLAGLVAVTVLSESRNAWASLLITLVGLAAVGPRSGRRVVGACALLALLSGVAILVSQDLSSSWLGRVELWDRALEAIRDFPVTGLGLGAFRSVLHTFYLPFYSADVIVPHAHNMYLQTALDIGLPGLVAYASLLVLSGFACWRLRWDSSRARRAAAKGLLGTIVAVSLFDLTDAVALGAKVGLLFWYTLGLIAALQAESGAGLDRDARAAGVSS